MMLDYETILTGVEFKVRQLINENISLKKQIWRLTEEKENLQEELKNKTSEYNREKEQNNIVKLRNTLIQKGDSTEIKLRINQMIRSIDKCLDLLNRHE
ncbi:MAG: hypothetical protein IJV22_04435 [Bacteroidales bacterium]|nr:hypothetical protein [Bacteroidales bacterium]